MEGKIFQDRYRLLERIGSGGMADVYRAEDTVLSRTVAVKVLYRSLAEDPDFVERFRREARSAASLSHPNIVAIYDWGAEESTYFIVMEFLEGKTLKDRLRREGALPQREAIRIAKIVASALAYAHKKGVIHRDVKPHNIIFTPDGDVKVTDFGIARGGSSTITQTGTILGTAQYVSPEQARGEDVDPSSDIYSLGIVLFEMLTGRVPFDGENPVSVALKQIEERPPLPSLIDNSIRVDLEKVVLKCLAKDRQLRYRTAEELIADLDRVEAGIPVSAQIAETTMIIPPSEQPKPRRKGKRTALVALIALLISGVAFGAGFAIYELTKPAAVKMISVPKLAGLTLDQAKTALMASELELKKNGEEYSDSVEEGQIISQTPGDGTSAKAGQTVSVIVSKGKPVVSVPNVIGETSDNATSKMMKVGLEPSGNNTYEYSDQIAEGRIITQIPEPGESVRKGATFTLTISKGPQTAQLPDTYNRPFAEASDILIKAGFKVTRSDEFSDTVPKDTVVRTAPQAGTSAELGSNVTVVVSKGPDLIPVPNVAGKTEEEAKTILQQAGLTPQIQRIPSSTQPGKVFGQSPADGELVKRNTPVTVYVGEASTSTPKKTTQPKTTN